MNDALYLRGNFVSETIHIICARCAGDTAISNSRDSDGALFHDPRFTGHGQNRAAPHIWFKCPHCREMYPVPVKVMPDENFPA